MDRAEVSSSVHVLTIFGLLLAAYCIAMLTRLAAVTKSIALPVRGDTLYNDGGYHITD